MREGFLKEKPLRGQLEPDVFPFLFSPRVQRAVFEQCAGEWRPETEREVLDCYFTSYFNAWLDDQNLYAGPKKAVTAFTPRLAMEAERLERFLAAYPDGTFVSIVRDPRAWYASRCQRLSAGACSRGSTCPPSGDRDCRKSARSSTRGQKYSFPIEVTAPGGPPSAARVSTRCSMA